MTAPRLHRARVWARRLRQHSGRLTRPIGRRLSAQSAYLDRLGDPARAVLVLGSARSGTTKLAEALASGRTTRFVFEPMNAGMSPYAPAGFVEGAYRRPEDPHPDLLLAWTAVLEGRIRSEWTDSRNRARIATRRVVKCIAANNLAGWLRHHFPATPIVFVYRHPLAVAASIIDLQARAGEAGVDRPRRRTLETMPRWVAESQLLDGPLAAFAPEVRRLFDTERTDYVDRAIRWCMENYVPLAQPPEAGFLVVRYENLVERPAEELRRIGRFVELDVTRGIREFDRPSSTDWGAGVRNRDGSRRDRRDGWIERVPADVGDAAMAVVDAFGLTRYLDAT